jgi:mobilome CxxCx(11)CxxC protein
MDRLREEAWDRALHADGTAYLFKQRGRFYKILVTTSTALALVPAIVVGTVALGGLDPRVAVAVMGVVGIPLALLSVWSLAANWQDRYAAATQSAGVNQQLDDAYKQLLADATVDEAEFRRRLQVLQTQDGAQRDRDLNQHVTDAEMRRGLRAALRTRGKECSTCNLKPTDMKPTDCGVCGEFPRQWWRR